MKAANVHLAMQGIYGFRQELGFYPDSNNREHMKQMLMFARKFSEMVSHFYLISAAPDYVLSSYSSINLGILLSYRISNYQSSAAVATEPKQ